MQGLIWSKRCGTTQNIGLAARIGAKPDFLSWRTPLLAGRKPVRRTDA